MIRLDDLVSWLMRIKGTKENWDMYVYIEDESLIVVQQIPIDELKLPKSP